MLLHAFAKLAEVDVRIMHTNVLKLERRLACIEERIERSLNTLDNLSTGTKDMSEVLYHTELPSGVPCSPNMVSFCINFF
jgi:hypothetical protein